MLFKETIPKPNQIKIIISFVIVATIVTAFIIFKKDIYKVNENLTDAEKFYKEYEIVPVDNVYKYVTIKEAYELFSSENAVIFIGFKDCLWCKRYAKTLDMLAKEKGVDKVYYLDIYNDRKTNSKEYNNLVELLQEYLSEDKDNNKRIYAPDVYFVKSGKIIGHNNDTSKEEGTDVEEYYYLNETSLIDALNELFDKTKVCNDEDSKAC